MKTFTFNITQELRAHYDAKVSIKASSEKAARKKLEKMSSGELNDLAFDWEQNTDNAYACGDITIEDLYEEEED